MSRMRIYKAMDIVNIILPEDFADIINDMGAEDYIHLKYEERGRAAFGKRLKWKKNPARSRGNGRKALYKGEKGHRHGMPEKRTL